MNNFEIARERWFLMVVLWGAATVILARGATPPVVEGVEKQPLVAQVRRVVGAMDYLGVPLSGDEKAELEGAFGDSEEKRSTAKIQEVLDRHCLILAEINPESRVHVLPGPAKPELHEKGWSQFLIKVHNAPGLTGHLRAFSPEAQAVFSGNQRQLGMGVPGADLGDDKSVAIADRWMDLQMYDSPPLAADLSGLLVEYRIVQIYSRDAGKREATVGIDVGQGSQDLGFRSELPLLFDCRAATAVTLHVHDENGQPTIASFLIRDRQGRIYPSQAKRLAPDFAFQPQVYRGDGDVLRLPAGEYDIEFSRGPESVPEARKVTVTEGASELSFAVKRWIDPSTTGWWSGDHHIHAAGCMHYTSPTEGVRPEDMIRHVIGEDLKVGANLTWGPCFDFQQQFFCGTEDKVSRYPYLLRYDIEVSGFGSHQSGHLDLLRLRDQHYPGTKSTAGWPTLCLDTLRWAKAQGAVVGFAHSGWGLQVKDHSLPNYEIPPYDSIGANEYIVDVTHEIPGPTQKLEPAIDFISAGDTPPAFELNIWYHTLNAGFRTRIAGETDFPCIYGERVGIGRSYVKLDGTLDYNDWCEGVRKGRSYVSDGKSHLMDYAANGVHVGEHDSELALASPATITLTVNAAALLDPVPDPRLGGIALHDETNPGGKANRPFWSIERARVGTTNQVPVEVVVNGRPVAVENLSADGSVRPITFHVPIERSSWVALRVLGSSHTNPIFVVVDEKPIRASRKSLEWCLKGVDQCWSQKEKFISADEMEAAKAAYEHARDVYRARLAQADVD